MIFAANNESSFEYDIHSLIKAFYPGEEVKVSGDISESEADFTLNFSGNKFCFSDKAGLFANEAEVGEGTDRAEVKNILKRLIYQSLSKSLNVTLPWGDLTGIRPTKIATKLLNEKKSDSEILDYMKKTYLVSDKKALLSIEIAKREARVIDLIDKDKGYSIYIGIPFCPTTCLYCSFTSNPIVKYQERIDEYIGCIEKELAFTIKARQGKILDTIYIGGGTPTSLDAGRLDKLLGMIERYVDVRKLKEFTVEAGRPDSIDIDKLRVLKAHHVSRISINPQTMNQKTLDIIGRRHSVEDVVKAFKLARKVGMDNINADIILGLPSEGEEEVLHTAEEIKKLSPESLTVHSLAIKRGSRLNETLSDYKDMTVNTPRTMQIAEELAYSLNLKPYYLYRQKNMAGNFENTGYAKEGAYGIYNILIMEEVEPIIALGAGSVTKIIDKNTKPQRCDNVKDVSLYMDSIDEMIERKRVLFTLEDK